MLLGTYCCYLVFQLHTHRHIFEDGDEPGDGAAAALYQTMRPLPRSRTPRPLCLPEPPGGPGRSHAPRRAASAAWRLAAA